MKEKLIHLKTLLLAGLFVLLGLVLLVPLAIWTPAFAEKIAADAPEFAYLQWPCTWFVWGTALPFYWALIEVLRICFRVVKGRPFSEGNARSFTAIGICAWIDTIAYVICLIVLWNLKAMGPPFLIAIAAVILFGITVGLAAEVVSQLLRRALELQTDAELTV